jgi:predicted RecB family nuclease
MPITGEIFQAFLNCETKSHLLSSGAVGTQREFADWQDRQAEKYKQDCLNRLRAKYQENEKLICQGTPNDLKKAAFCLAVECSLQADGLQTQIHTLEELAPSDQKKQGAYLPIRFVPREKVTSQDKLLLAFDALVLSAVSGRQPASGKIIHGVDQKVMKVNLSDLVGKAKAIVSKIAAQQAKASPPSLILNKHCAECEFKTRCRQIAVEKDDLSLLSGLSEKERKKQHSKGIFTVTQLSYTYRPRRRPKRLAAKPDNYSHALRALAIRENKIHIAGSPKLNITGTPVYLDVEGVPDRDFYYLVGLRIKSGDAYVQHSFWANDAAEEKVIWAAFLQALAQIENPQLVHYGSYETAFLKQMKARYGSPVGNADLLDQLIKEAVNVLSVIYAQIYLPTYSNSLKEIAPYLGFQWSESDASGLASLVWRSVWERTEDTSLKQKLVIYNAEDCEALERVTAATNHLCRGRAESKSSRCDEIVHTDSLKHHTLFSNRNKESAIPEFKFINQSAYWDYQRERIYIRDRKQIKHTPTRTTTASARTPPINEVLQWAQPSCCLKCKSVNISKRKNISKIVYDLKFGRTGMKRWIVKLLSRYYTCQECGATFRDERPWAGGKCGPNAMAYLIYQMIELRLSQDVIKACLKRFFAIDMAASEVNRMKSKLASLYKDTYEAILNKIVRGKLIHADETKINILGKSGYIWVLTSHLEVAYFYAETREGDKIQELLKDYKGVLVSDFYAVYDSIDCPQQKCLIHLLRDLDSDLRKQPFNEELKGLVNEFAALLKAVVETIDRFGLKARYLRKYKGVIERFYKRLFKSEYKSDLAVKYKKRFEKNREKLFTFLDFDGVPWNNNNAEHAIKAFARLRKAIGGASTEKGIRDYLTLLSISETCKYKGVSFLNFLRSGEKDIDAFIKKGSRVTSRAPQAG